MGNEAMEAWKSQFDTALRLVEALTEGAMKMHETQLEAATDTHASAVAAQQSALKAGDPAELVRIQSQWAMRNLEHATAYWRQLFEAALETNARMVKCLSQQQVGFSVPAQPFDVEASRQALLGMVDKGYKQWLEAAKQLYSTSAKIQ